MVIFEHPDMPVSIENEKIKLAAASCLKRSKSFGAANSVSFNPYKKVCLSPNFTRSGSAATLYSNSSDSDDGNSEDDDTCYLNNQRKARKRAFSMKSRRSLSFVDNVLNNAISKYSDEDEQAEVPKSESDDANNCHYEAVAADVSSKSSLNSPVSKMKEISGSSGIFFQEGARPSNKSSSGEDQTARNRCFDYLVGAIDEAWARYCDATSYAEDEALNKTVEYLPNTPASIGFSEPEEEEEEDDDDDDDVEEGYRSASTNITEYDSELDKKGNNQPSSLKLQHLKDRLLKAKYYLQDYVDSYEEEDCISFWRRWDLVKYATIELVEDDDDDEIIESTIEELERGRLYGCE